MASALAGTAAALGHRARAGCHFVWSVSTEGGTWERSRCFRRVLFLLVPANC